VSPGFVVWQVASVWQRAVRTALDEVGLTHAQFVLLASAAWLEAQASESDGPVTQVLIATHARTDAVMTSEVLRTLERKALVRRLPHPTDARARHIVLTPAGRRMVRRAVARVEAVDEAFFASPGPELRALAALLCGRR
jgi:DNA-binding MarR family transcriptional regulator